MLTINCIEVGALPCGQFWEKMNNYEDRARCGPCNTIESPEHILTECKHSGQEIVWRSVRQIFEKRNIPWSRVTLGKILGCGIVNLKTENGKSRMGANRLYSIMISEAAFFIWKLRCEWVIQKERDPNREPSASEIRNKWFALLNQTVRFDILAARYKPGNNNSKKDKRSPEIDMVINTWWDIVTSNEDLTWESMTSRKRNKTGVLVGIG
jgi:hypothetical protein